MFQTKFVEKIKPNILYLVTFLKIGYREINQQEAPNLIFIMSLLSTCFGHHYSHHQEKKTVYYCICCSALVVLAVVGWSWVLKSVHRVKFTVRTVRPCSTQPQPAQLV